MVTLKFLSFIAAYCLPGYFFKVVVGRQEPIRAIFAPANYATFLPCLKSNFDPDLRRRWIQMNTRMSDPILPIPPLMSAPPAVGRASLPVLKTKIAEQTAIDNLDHPIRVIAQPEYQNGGYRDNQNKNRLTHHDLTFVGNVPGPAGDELQIIYRLLLKTSTT
jgi:hypothetical protein